MWNRILLAKIESFENKFLFTDYIVELVHISVKYSFDNLNIFILLQYYMFCT